MQQLERALYRELYLFFAPAGREGQGAPRTATDLPRPLARGLVHLYDLLHATAVSACDEYRADRVASALAGRLSREWSESVVPPAHDDGTLTLPECRKKYPERREVWNRLSEQWQHADTPALRVGVSHRIRQQVREAARSAAERRSEQALRSRITPIADHLNFILPLMAQADTHCRRVFGHPGAWDPFVESWTRLNWEQLEKVQRETDSLVGAERIMSGVLAWSRARAGGDGPAQSAEHGLSRGSPRRRGAETELGEGNSIVSALPDELALLAFPETEDLFARKFANSGILALRRVPELATGPRSTANPPGTVPAHPTASAPPQGAAEPGRRPLYVCVDTSGSMKGRRGALARGLLLGLVRAALERNRDVVMLATQDRLRRVELPAREASYAPERPDVLSQPLRMREDSIRALMRFLSAGEAGGADLEPALRHVLGHMRADSRSEGDLLLVSDTRLPRVHPQHQLAIESLRSRQRLKLYAVSLSGIAMEDPLNVLDEFWSIDPDSGRVSGGAPIGIPRVFVEA